MTPEHLLVPYQCSDLPPGPWLVFAPHADDETFGMGGTLRKAADQGIQTHVVVLTDGALGGPSESDSAAAQLVETRRQEVQAACELLGVTTLQTWDQPDRGLQMSDVLLERVATAIADLNAATVFFPAVLELHPDHRSTAQLVWCGAQRLLSRPWRGQAPQLWSYEISVQSPVNRLIDITAELQCKNRAMAIYASQNSQNNYPELILALNKARTFSMPPQVSHVEAFYAYSPTQLELSLRQAAGQALALYWENA
ncbi:MAG: PIG-L deacetylase family protein [Pseudohongiella sp.]|nr:PIG-L deacetylase family protein [Pseudohongiella sp.]